MLKSKFSGSRNTGDKGGGEEERSEQALKGKEGGKMREKGWEERAPKAPSKNTDFGIPMIYVLFSGLPSHPNTSETGIGGVKTYRMLEGGGGTRPEGCLCKAWTFDPQIEDLL